jgi:hypothetical protein
MLPASFDIAGIRVRRISRKSSLFTAICKISQSARYDSAPNRVYKEVDISRKPIISFKHILRYDIFNPLMCFAGFRGFPQYFFYIVFSRAIWVWFASLKFCFCVFLMFFSRIFVVLLAL